MRENVIYWSVFVGLGVLLWVSSATSSRAFQMAVIIAASVLVGGVRERPPAEIGAITPTSEERSVGPIE